MTPGTPTADLIFTTVCDATAYAHAIAMDTDETELRRALAALSAFKGPGTFARDVAITIIRDELAAREAEQ